MQHEQQVLEDLNEAREAVRFGWLEPVRIGDGEVGEVNWLVLLVAQVEY